MPLFFPFIAILSVSHPTGSNSRSAKKWLFFALWKKWYYRCLSICLLLLFHIRGTSQVPEKKKSNPRSSSHGVRRLDETFLVASCLSTRKKETNAEQSRQQSSPEVEHRAKQLKNCYAPHLLEVDYIKDLLFSQQCTSSSPSQHSLRILSSLLPFTRNLPITRRPNSCTVLWQQLICWLVLLPSLSMLLIGCPWLGNTGAFDDTHLTQPKSQALHCF